MQYMYYVFAYNADRSLGEDIWCQLCWTRIMSYHEEVMEAGHAVSRLINEDMYDERECFAVGAIPLGSCHEHNLA